MNDNADFSLVEPMDVDDGELDELSHELCFVLGCEWEMVRRALAKKQPFERPIHSENLQRIRKMCDRYGASAKIAHHDDWPLLIVDMKSDQRR